MKRNRLRKTARKVVLTATMALVAAGVLQAGVHSDVVTASKWTQPAGPSFVDKTNVVAVKELFAKGRR